MKYYVRIVIMSIVSMFAISCIMKDDNEDIYSTNKVEFSEHPDYFVNHTDAVGIANNLILNEFLGVRFSNKRLEEVKSIKDEKDNVVFYIINYKEGGFFILAADKRSIPVLAYSFSNNFPVSDSIDYPHGLVDWLEFAKGQIQEIRDKDLKQPDEFIAHWEAIKTMKLNYSSLVLCNGNPTHVVFKEPLIQTFWHQDSGFNDYMPLAVPQYCSSINTSNNRFYAGCVPIAIAQVMRYHEHPTYFSFNEMHNTVATNASRAMINDLHNKIYYYYNSPPLKYKCDATSVSSSFPVESLLKNNYNYSTANSNSAVKYNELLMQNEILNNRPVILSGGKAKGWWIFKHKVDGHMWVADGLEKYTFCIRILGNPIDFDVLRYDMNWGWGGDVGLNGFYSYGNFNPSSYDFNYKVKVVYNINP